MSQSEPNLTVVIPVHNAAPHLGACVESLLAQSYTDFELILVENGSSDDSRERCARYAAEHPGRIRTLTLDEASVSAARNAGIDNARGRFITFMDADDWAEKEFLAEFFRDPAPGPGTIVMQGILLDFSEAEPPGPNEAFFSYDDGALAIGDDPSAAVGQRFLQDGCSVCKLYHTETLRRLGIRFIEHLCSREDHLFFFTCISRMQSVVWRSGLYMHYMRRGRNTLSTRPMPACELVEAAERLDRFIPQLAERFGITDKTYLFALRQHFVHRAVEGAEHPREGVAQLDVGVSPEGLGHEARLLALGAVLLFAVTVDAVADQRVVEPHRGEEDHDGEQRREGRVESQRGEQQDEEHRLGDHRGGGAQDPGGECQADDVDVARQHRGVRIVDEGQTPVVVGDVEAARKGAVEVVDVAAFGACQQEVDAAFEDDEPHDGPADRECERARRGDARPDVDRRQRPVALESRGVEHQRQHRQQGRESRQVQHGAQHEGRGDAETPAAECGGKASEDASHGSTFSILPSFTYHRYPSAGA